MNKVAVKKNQTIYDIAAEQYGTTEAVGEILANNVALKNDPAALIARGIDPLNDEAFYADIAVDQDCVVNIDADSKLINKMVIKQLHSEITTYKNGTDN